MQECVLQNQICRVPDVHSSNVLGKTRGCGLQAFCRSASVMKPPSSEASPESVFKSFLKQASSIRAALAASLTFFTTSSEKTSDSALSDDGEGEAAAWGSPASTAMARNGYMAWLPSNHEFLAKLMMCLLRFKLRRAQRSLVRRWLLPCMWGLSGTSISHDLLKSRYDCIQPSNSKFDLENLALSVRRRQILS